MDKKEICFIIKGKDAGDAADEIKKIIKDELDYDIPIRAEKNDYPDEQTKEIDPVAVAALIVALPAAILAIADLASRIKNKKKVDKALEKIEKQVVQKKEVSVRIQYPNGMIKEISAVDTVEIMDFLNK